jgi:hypothetical protein
VFSLSLRDVELIMAERGTLVTQESVRRWGLKFAHPQIYAVARRHNKRGSPPDKGENSESGVSLASGENLLRCNSLCGVVVFRPWMGGYNALPRIKKFGLLHAAPSSVGQTEIDVRLLLMKYSL